MNRTLERTTMIIIALLLSIGFTGQHHSHAEAKLWVKVNVHPYADDATMVETLTKSYIERELRSLDYIKVVDTLEKFTVHIYVNEPDFRSGGKTGGITLIYYLTAWHKRV